MAQRVGIIGVASTILAVLLAILSVVLPPMVRGQLATLPFVIIVLLLVAAAIFLLIVPRAVRSERAGLVGFVGSFLGLLLILPAFWSGLPIVLGAGGIVLGLAGQERSRTARGGGFALWAIVLGSAAIILDLFIFLLDRLT